jgi:deoxyribodipyrimidine photolyase
VINYVRYARFLVEAVQDLQRSLRERRSDLLVRFGEPETIVRGLVDHLKHETGVDVELFCQREVRSCICGVSVLCDADVMYLHLLLLSKHTKKNESRRLLRRHASSP